MVISRTDFGDIIYCRVTGWKPGSRSASESLTILKLEDMKTGEQYKMLCWNDLLGTKRLSDRARKLNVGDVITARVVFDVGDDKKCTAHELKKAGLYQSSLNNKKKYILCGEIKKLTAGKNVVSVMISSYRPDIETIFWYQVCWWRSSAEKVKNELRKGDHICVCCTNMVDKIYNGFQYKELTGAYYEKA